jgi:hypothetical protein
MRHAFLAFGLLLCPIGVSASTVEIIAWSALRPAEQSSRAEVMPNATTAIPSTDSLVWRNASQPIQLTGFMLPVDQQGDLVYEFILVPWAGACSHSPTPPPNQLVDVSLKKPFRISAIYQAVSITGLLQTGVEKAQLYIMDGTRVLTYGYRMKHASVVNAVRPNDPDVHAIPPGSFLSR